MHTHTCIHTLYGLFPDPCTHTRTHTHTHTCTPCKGCFQPATLAHCVCHVVELLFVNTLTAPTVQGLNDVLGGVPHQTPHAVHHAHAVVDLGLHKCYKIYCKCKTGCVKQCREVMPCILESPLNLGRCYLGYGMGSCTLGLSDCNQGTQHTHFRTQCKVTPVCCGPVGAHVHGWRAWPVSATPSCTRQQQAGLD